MRTYFKCHRVIIICIAQSSLNQSIITQSSLNQSLNRSLARHSPFLPRSLAYLHVHCNFPTLNIEYLLYFLLS